VTTDNGTTRCLYAAWKEAGMNL